MFVPNIGLSSTFTPRNECNSVVRQADATLDSAVEMNRQESKQVSVGGGCGSSMDQTLGSSSCGSGLSGIPVYLRSCLLAAGPDVRLRWLTDASNGLGGECHWPDAGLFKDEGDEMSWFPSLFGCPTNSPCLCSLHQEGEHEHH